ncbi:MAG: DoxX family membrane protein [Actinophytocola sp.]|nr:DoxX family membrane protein [Actinophytocola sp.]
MSTHDELYGQETTQVPSTGGRRHRDEPAHFLNDYDSVEPEEEPVTRWHSGLDLGLLILRVAVGGTAVLHGLYRYGLFGGPGMDGVAEGLAANGFASQTTLLAWLLAVTEVGAGGLLVLGMFSPLAAAAILSITSTAVYLHRGIGYFPLVQVDGAQLPGYAFPLMVGAAALALLFTGPGRIAIDVATTWRRKPVPFGIVGVLLAAGAAVAVLVLFR